MYVSMRLSRIGIRKDRRQEMGDRRQERYGARWYLCSQRSAIPPANSGGGIVELSGTGIVNGRRSLAAVRRHAANWPTTQARSALRSPVAISYLCSMRVLLQRVSEASVTIEGRVAGAIGRGMLVLVGF